MTVQLDHLLVPSADMNASAKLLADILGVPWEPSGGAQSKSPVSSEWLSGGLSQADWKMYYSRRASVYVNDSLTLDFVSPTLLMPTAAASGPVPINHYCFRVGDADFDAIVERIKKAGVKFSSTLVGEPDYKVYKRFGGKGVYFLDADGHGWEILTVSYARQRK
jgi:catechol 2,3-dioxygenase-like lactoylglutathione lyase family enzyme